MLGSVLFPLEWLPFTLSVAILSHISASKHTLDMASVEVVGPSMSSLVAYLLHYEKETLTIT